MIKVFWIESTKRDRISLRRYQLADDCPGARTHHDASVPIGEWQRHEKAQTGDIHPHDDARWPVKCDACDYRFKDTDQWQLNRSAIYRRPDTGQEMTLSDAPVGACWDANWYGKVGGFFVGEDGRCLCVRIPGPHDWIIDSRASNCTMPNDKVHKCWCRHGRPEDGTLHVDKNCNTCKAGGGSIQTGDWHGFLHNGHLVKTP